MHAAPAVAPPPSRHGAPRRYLSGAQNAARPASGTGPLLAALSAARAEAPPHADSRLSDGPGRIRGRGQAAVSSGACRQDTSPHPPARPAVRTRDSPKRWAPGAVSEKYSGGDLLSQGASPQVPSALAGLTSVFGMGTGVTLSLWPPKPFALPAACRRTCTKRSCTISGRQGRRCPTPL